MSLQYRKAPGSWREDTNTWLRSTMIVGGVAFLFFAIAAGVAWTLSYFAVKPTAVSYWGWFGSAVLGGLLFIRAVYKRLDWEETVVFLLGPPLLVLLFHLKSGAFAYLAPLIAVASTVLLVEGIGTHYIYWLTAHPRLQVEERRKKRLLWWLRFFVILPWHFAYGAGYLVLYLYYLMYRSHSPVWLFWSLPPAVALVMSLLLGFSWRIWKPLIQSLSALQSWLSWGRWEGIWGSRTPGLFRSPLGPYGVRVLVTAAAFVLIAAPYMRLSDLDPRGPIPIHIWLLQLIGICFLPVPVVFSTLLAVAGPSLAREHTRIERISAKRQWKPEWMGYAGQLARSKHKLERDHYWLGAHAEANYPVLAHEKVLSEHVHILGDSGSGKTHRGLVPLLTQIIRRGQSGVVIIDLKGDEVMFQTMKEEARRAGLTFKWFTNVIGHSTFVFNPFQQLNRKNVSINQMCELFLDAMRLNHGDGYGRSYFTRVARSWLSDTLQKYPKLKNFDELYEKTTPEFFKGGAKEREDCYELVSVLQSLASVDQLNFGRIPGESEDVLKNAIYMPDVISNNEVVYFYLPSSRESSTVREIANLALFTLYTSSTLSKDGKQTYLVIDEFQRIASRAFEVVLQQARSAGLSVVLANQTLADLKTTDAPSLAGVVKANTRLKVFFSATEPELQEELVKTSGETIYNDYFYETEDELRDLKDNRQYRNRIGPRANVNDVLRYSAAEETAIIRMTRDSGYSQFGGHWFPVVTDYAMTQDTFFERKGRRWPKVEQGKTIKTERVSRRYREMVEKQEAGQMILGREVASAAGDTTARTGQGPQVVVNQVVNNVNALTVIDARRKKKPRYPVVDVPPDRTTPPRKPELVRPPYQLPEAKKATAATPSVSPISRDTVTAKSAPPQRKEEPKQKTTAAGPVTVPKLQSPAPPQRKEAKEKPVTARSAKAPSAWAERLNAIYKKRSGFTEVVS